MPYNPAVHHRRSIRLPGYDYTQPGAYFITACTHDRAALFGEIIDGEMRLNDYGRLVEYTWHDLVHHVPGIELGEFVVMPNHMHGIIIIIGGVGAGSEPAPTEPAPTEPAPAPTTPLSEIVRQFKTFSARRINEKRGTRGVPVWQRNYWERIIRDELAYQTIAGYIRNNPARWQADKLHSSQNSHDAF